MGYAEGTKTSAATSRGQIEDLLTRAGATRFMTGFDTEKAAICFEMRGRMIRFEIQFPNPSEKRFTEIVRGRVYKTTFKRSADDARRLHDAECRRLWRCLLLHIRAKLSSIEDGISTFDVEFLPFVVMPGGKTVAQWLLPEIDEAARTGRLPELPRLGSGAAH